MNNGFVNVFLGHYPQSHDHNHEITIHGKNSFRTQNRKTKPVESGIFFFFMKIIRIDYRSLLTPCER